ncbi:MAG: aspartyl-phosphate phosphatase Spo0E family protein [Negativicutes bacterium]|nr:aspartyl-phosphate phosphatase Spo0E family protein [Negativicutes bacterium]
MVKGFKILQLTGNMDSLREKLQKLVKTKGLVDEEVLTLSRELDEQIVYYLRVLKNSSRL